MAATENPTSAKDTAEQYDSFLAVYSTCRDYTDKLDLLAFAVNELGDSKLTKTSAEYLANKQAVNPIEGFATLRDMVNSGPAESMEEAKRMAEEAGVDLPEEGEGDTFEDQVGTQPEGSDPKAEDRPKANAAAAPATGSTATKR